MTKENFEKYPFITYSDSLKSMWNNERFPFDCLKASKIIAAIIAQEPTFAELLTILGTVRKLIDPYVLRKRHQDLEKNKDWLVNFFYDSVNNMHAPELNFHQRWMAVYAQYKPYFTPNNLGSHRHELARTIISDNPRYGDMRDGLYTRFYAQKEEGNCLRIKFHQEQHAIIYSIINYIPSENGFLIQHTAPNDFVHAKPVIATLYASIINDEEYRSSQDKFLVFVQNIGKLNWHLSQAMFYERGSAAISELLITAIFIYKNIPLPQYKEKITCDLMAIFSSSPDLYAAEFINHFEWNALENYPVTTAHNGFPS